MTILSVRALVRCRMFLRFQARIAMMMLTLAPLVFAIFGVMGVVTYFWFRDHVYFTLADVRGGIVFSVCLGWVTMTLASLGVVMGPVGAFQTEVQKIDNDVQDMLMFCRKCLSLAWLRRA